MKRVGNRVGAAQSRWGIRKDAPGFPTVGAGAGGAGGVMRIRRTPTAATGGPRAASSQAVAFAPEALAFLDSLYRTALRLSRDRADAEDLVQETYLKAFRAADRFEPGTNLRAWLFTILHNTAKNRFRDRARDTVAIDSDVVDRAAAAPAPGLSASEPETPETLMLRDTLAPDLQAAIDSLPDQFREAVWLRDVEEFSYAEIAGMLGVPIGTVMSRISRGRHLLFERLSPRRVAALSGKT